MEKVTERKPPPPPPVLPFSGVPSFCQEETSLTKCGLKPSWSIRDDGFDDLPAATGLRKTSGRR